MPETLQCGAHPDLTEPCRTCYECPSCCGCITCTQCRTRHNRDDSYTCEHCNGCQLCCECRTCSRDCGGLVVPECPEGLHCDRHCDCEVQDEESERNVAITRHSLTFHNATTFAINPSRRYLSVEIEVAKCGPGSYVNAACEKWKASIVEDGSLPDSGFEINTAPANGDLFVNQISEICGALARQGASVNDRCGLHVHIDARTFRAPTMRKLLKLYVKLERALFLLVPDSRRHNQYCTPVESRLREYLNPKKVEWCIDSTGRLIRNENGVGLKKEIILAPLKGAKETREKIAEYTYGDGVKVVPKRLRRNKYGGERYKAFNLVSWYHRGTIECRLFNGTINATKIVNWAMLWAGILDYAKRTHENAIDSLPEHSDSEPLRNLMLVAPTGTVKEWVKQRFDKWGINKEESE